MKICEYGCGQEAKFPPSKGKPKWSCEPFWQQCPAKRKEHSIVMKKLQKNPNSKYNSDSYREKRRYIMKEKWEDPDSVFNSDSWREKRSEANKGKNNPSFLTIEKIKERHPFFSEIEELRYNPDKPEEKEIQVHCKNNNCPNSKEKSGWFIPTSKQFKDRKDYLTNEGEDKLNFYCSQHCKDTCPVYNSKGGDPYRNTKSPYTLEEQRTWRSKVLMREVYICEWCEGVATIAHHVLPVKTHPLLALDPDNGVACCEDCHYKYGHKTGTECSTKALANKILPDCKLGGQE